MTELLRAFPDAEAVGLAVLDPIGIATVTATPITIVPPLYQVIRVGGTDDGITDHPHLEVTCFHDSRAGVWGMTGLAQQRMLASRAQGFTLADGSVPVVDYVVTISSPEQVPYEDESLRCTVAIYQLSMRRCYFPTPWSLDDR